MDRCLAALSLTAIAVALTGCGCRNELAAADTLTIAGTIPEFDGYRPCGGTDGECWAVGEAVVTYTDGSVKAWTDTHGRREFFIRSASFSNDGRFDWTLHELLGDAFTAEKEVANVRYRIELVNRHSEGGATILTYTDVCFEGTVLSEQFIAVEQDPFISPEERASCDVSQRAILQVEAEFVRSDTCPAQPT